jgi:hypothetical protein
MDAGAAVKVPDDAAGTKGQFADEASMQASTQRQIP